MEFAPSDALKRSADQTRAGTPIAAHACVGHQIQNEAFDDAAFARYSARLDDSVRALRMLCAREGFGRGETTIGAELELHLVDGNGGPSPLSRAVLADTVGATVTLEIDRFNLELNTDPLLLAGCSLQTLASQLECALREVRRAAVSHGVRAIAIGILPTLVESDLCSSALTESPRYRALSSGIRRLRGGPVAIAIDGDEHVRLLVDDVTLEGANTSFQVHLRVDPEQFARAYNVAQIATAPVLAASGNSPLFLQRRLWEETRVALFRQSIDHRNDAVDDDWRPARVSFGHGWVRSSAIELFAENVALHEPLLPVTSDEDPLAIVVAGGVPELAELRLHQGTVWRWNRAVYDGAAGGHLRIEFRALPAGPTVADMVANAAFMLGLTLGLLPDAEDFVTRMTFGHARRNFYEAARHGLDAELLWPRSHTPSPSMTSARALVLALLPVARRGLVDNGVAGEEADRYLAIVARRVDTGMTGARWQRATFDALARGATAIDAARAMLERYAVRALDGTPVGEWEIGA